MRALDEWAGQVQPLSAIREVPLKNMFKALAETDDDDEEGKGKIVQGKDVQARPKADAARCGRLRAKGQANRGLAPACRRNPPTTLDGGALPGSKHTPLDGEGARRRVPGPQPEIDQTYDENLRNRII